jgi:hypothetical protein
LIISFEAASLSPSTGRISRMARKYDSMITKHSKSGPRSKPLHFYVNDEEVRAVDALATQFNTDRGIPVSRSLVIRTAIELLTKAVRRGYRPRPPGKTMERTFS